ncbi:MAG: DUF5343 domain-containing protein [Planctomycetota bacterium]
MALTSAYVLPTNRIPDVFQQIRDGQAPDRVTQQLLKDWGFTSKNDRAFLPLLKALRFLSPDGKPTQRYHDYRDHSRSKSVMADALRDAYEDLFLIKSKPSESDREAIEGKLKSFHNASDNVAALQAKTFYELLKLADLEASNVKAQAASERITVSDEATPDSPIEADFKNTNGISTSLHYNIQIHLPATKDVEVYNAIFKSLREHLLEP